MARRRLPADRPTPRGTLRYCTACGEWVTLECFWLNANNRKPRRWCRSCHRKYKTGWWRKGKARTKKK